MRCVYPLLIVGIFAAGAGCSRETVIIVGKLTKGGEPLSGRVHMVLIPVTEGNQPAMSHYFADVRKDGSYRVPGKRGKGIPPGQYRIALTILDRPNELQGKFDKEITPIVRTVTTEQSEQTIDLELDRPTEGGQ